MVDRCMCLLAEVVRRFGGSVHQIAGDAMLAVFGAPVAHEDDAERAVRAALKMQQCARENAADFGGLTLRVGVNTGEVLFAPVGPEGRRDQAVVGDIVNTAARLQTSAPTSAILVGEETWHATHSSIAYEAVGPFRVKNKAEPIRAWLATGCSAIPAGRAISAVPLFGREAELHQLSRLWHDVEAGARPHVVNVVGPAGIGKSRLCREFGAVIENRGGRVLLGRSLSYGESTGYGSFARILKRATDIVETDSVEQGRAKLARRIERLVPEALSGAVIAHLSVILGLASEDLVSDRKALFVSAARFVEGLAAEQPTVLCFEDTHWAEPSLLDLVEFLGSNVRGAPTLFLMSARPEPFDVRERWTPGQASCTTLHLGALSEAAAEELSARLLAPSRQAASMAARLREAAGGNPLFIEELAASLSKGTTDASKALPTSLRTLIAARLDSLPPGQRRVLLDASVVGGTFWRGALAELVTDQELDEALESLEAQDLIRRENDSRLEGDVEFSFKHMMIRDVSYGTLLKSSRRRRHEVVARFIESAPGARTAETTPLLAHHWRQSSHPDRAIDYLLVAAEQAGRGWAKREAVTLYNEALELLPKGDPRRPGATIRRAVAFQAWLHASLDVVPTEPVGGPADSQDRKSSGPMSPAIS